MRNDVFEGFKKSGNTDVIMVLIVMICQLEQNNIFDAKKIKNKKLDYYILENTIDQSLTNV
jgi:hypothetical protein